MCKKTYIQTHTDHRNAYHDNIFGDNKVLYLKAIHPRDDISKGVVIHIDVFRALQGRVAPLIGFDECIGLSSLRGLSAYTVFDHIWTEFEAAIGIFVSAKVVLGVIRNKHNY